MIFNGLLICVVFLILFGLSLWPVLLKNSKHFKLVLIAVNLVFLAMVIFFGASVSRTETTWQEKRKAFREETLPAVASKLEGTEKINCTKIPETEQNIEKIEGTIQEFSRGVAK